VHLPYCPLIYFFLPILFCSKPSLQLKERSTSYINATLNKDGKKEEEVVPATVTPVLETSFAEAPLLAKEEAAPAPASAPDTAPAKAPAPAPTPSAAPKKKNDKGGSKLDKLKEEIDIDDHSISLEELCNRVVKGAVDLKQGKSCSCFPQIRFHTFLSFTHFCPSSNSHSFSNSFCFLIAPFFTHLLSNPLPTRPTTIGMTKDQIDAQRAKDGWNELTPPKDTAGDDFSTNFCICATCHHRTSALHACFQRCNRQNVAWICEPANYG
jgi:hypothetical protein